MKLALPGRVIIRIGQPSAAWCKALPRAVPIARRAAQAALGYGFKSAPHRRTLRDKISLGGHFELGVALGTNAAVQRLNRSYRGKDTPTNVLSFPASMPNLGRLGGPCPLGDVIVAFGVAKAESRAANKSLEAHLSHLVLHGVLHLLGYDHKAVRDTTIMEQLESQIMARMGFADPYGAVSIAPPRRSPRRKSSRSTVKQPYSRP